MATKRQAVAQLSNEDLNLLALAAEQGAGLTKEKFAFTAKDKKAVKRAVSVLRDIRAYR